MTDFLYYLLTWSDDAVGKVHLGFAGLALLAGALVMVLRKGTAIHGLLGYVYLLSMGTLNVTALFTYDLTGSPNLFHVFAVFSIVTISAAYGAIVYYRITRKVAAARAHGELMIWSYFGLFAALIAEVVTREFPYLLHGEGGWVRFSLALTAFMAVAAYFTNRFIRFALRRTFG